ncbi:probable transcription elongation factor SPT4 2 [Ramularia collo-cygni]|uniref:Transcription elongation factor SPT4 n=1 Tax=Ramularia collo-cygni TaxID=112498 RepID=A0A2D3V0A1_9PEZI|nr:probable transcription elongation factor SPT4 2 [Ramularia collo-cygni]CZT23747.1 probable transcription elongation factor SPT4 2 [Ramularia collo-cygni]
MSHVPRSLRACLVCTFIQSTTSFVKTGCPNCEDFLEMRNNADVVTECTSEVFEGTITLNDTGRSWVARWSRLDGYVPGVYAVKVNGSLPEEYIAAMDAAGVTYIPRDGSASTDD